MNNGMVWKKLSNSNIEFLRMLTQLMLMQIRIGYVMMNGLNGRTVLKNITSYLNGNIN